MRVNPNIKRYNKNRTIKKNVNTRNINIKNNNSTNKLTDVPIKYYMLKYKNTNLLPKTEIFNYLFNNFNDYLNTLRLANSLGTIPLRFDDCFLMDYQDFPVGLRKNNISLNLKMNPKTPLDKLIAYCFYIKQPEIFRNKTQEQTIELIKYQMGKDISRDDRTINGKSYNRSYYQQNASNNYLVADLFYQNIIDYVYQVNKKINLNIVNKFALISCQNIYNLITDLVTMKLNDVLAPETNTVFRPDKFINIVINTNKFTMDLMFESQLIISRDGNLDPEYPCGNLKFNLSIDIRKNTYELTEFILNYDIDKCGPEIQSNIISSINEPSDNKYSKLKYIIPAGLAVAGLAATPFLLASLGGKKTKRNHNKKNKQIKYNKSTLNYTKNKTKNKKHYRY